MTIDRMTEAATAEVPFVIGSTVWFYSQHIASYPCDSNTRQAIYQGIDSVNNDGVPIARVEELDGEPHFVEIGCVSLSDPRLTYRPDTFEP